MKMAYLFTEETRSPDEVLSGSRAPLAQLKAKINIYEQF